MHWCFQAIKNYANFSGRACRREYWAFALMDGMIIWGSLVIAQWKDVSSNPWFIAPFAFYMLFMFCPALSVTFRRLHDVNITGAYALWLGIPVVGWIMVSIQLFTQGDKGENNYGMPPSES